VLFQFLSFLILLTYLATELIGLLRNTYFAVETIASKPAIIFKASAASRRMSKFLLVPFRDIISEVWN